MLRKERKFWNDFESCKEETRLRIREEEKSEAVNGNEVFILKEKLTDKLLHMSNRAYNTQINDLLLAALGMAVKKSTGQRTVAIGMEGHGRENIHKPVNISRTVGWFTTMHPVVLKCADKEEDAVVSTKDMLRKVPNNGIGYGLLYNTELCKYVDINFNYLGEIDSENREELMDTYTGESISSENIIPGYININANISGGKFICVLTYNNCTKEYAEKLGRNYEESLKKVIEWCSKQKKVQVTESDMYMLTPLQEGMYFHSQLDKDDASYHLQTAFRSNRRINITYLRKSLKMLTEKYEVLKTAFKENKADGRVRQYISDA